MALILTYINKTAFPTDLGSLTLDAMAGKSLAEIRRLPLFHGNQKVPLAELFRVEGDPSDHRWHFLGDLSGVHGIGAGMRTGTIHIHGSAGRHLGSQMRGGQITVDGNTDDWTGAEMRGGLIRIHGNAGNRVGAAYDGSRTGMNGGAILIDGNAGHAVGGRMRRGWIGVGGAVGDWVGKRMLAGSILVFGCCGSRPGAAMRRGTIVLLGNKTPRLLPTFRYACRYRPPMFSLMARQLRSHQFSSDVQRLNQEFDLHHGDFLESGRGEILTIP